MVWYKWAIFAFIITVCQAQDIKVTNCECGVLGGTSRIVNGWVSDPHRFPWIVAIYYSGNIFCGGAIINNLYILSAGHCVRWSKKEAMQIHVGAHDLGNRMQQDIFNVERFILHHDFYTYKLYDENDIALIKVDRPIYFSATVLPVCLPDKDEMYENSFATVAGWGRLGDRRSTSNLLRETVVKVYPEKVCKESKMGKYMTPTVMCAFRNHTDSCQGDSGGPLILETEPGKAAVIGVVSWGMGCASDTPGIYTRVSAYLEWIYENTEDAVYCEN